MILYLVRHGETAYNRDGVGLGRDDVPLTERGLVQAAALGGRFAGIPLDRVLSSPLARARSTAAAIAGEHEVPVEVREELLELDVGVTERMPFGELRARYPEFLAQWAGPGCASARMPGGESLEDVAARIEPLIEELQLASGEHIAVVSHNFVTKVLLCRLLELPITAFRNFAIDLASVSTVRLRNGRAVISSLNDCCHLDHLES